MTLAAPIGVAHSQSPAPSRAPVVIGYLAPANETAAAVAYRRGVEMGIQEARRAGDLLDRAVGYVELRSEAPGRMVLDDVGTLGAHAVIAPIADPSDLRPLAEWAARARIPVIALGPVGGGVCDPFVFRIAPPPSVDAASLLSGRAHAGTATGPSPAPARMRIAFWHPSLARFGAAQLSDRFRARHGVAMTSDAWAGWMAVKIIWESALRATAADALRDAIARSAFDGHKGRALRFGPDNILRQPLMIVIPDVAGTPDRLVAEIDWPESVAPGEPPAASAAGGSTAPATTGVTCGSAA